MTAFIPDYRVAEVLASPNHGERRDGRQPDMIILHYTGMPTAQGALDWLITQESEVSSHYLVFEDGRVVQMVPEERRAWHAGKSFWKGDTDINSSSIGIEVANPGHPGGLPDYPGPQIAAVIALCQDIVGRWTIPAERVLAHSDVAPVRKVDPGERFPWDELALAGIGHYVEPAQIGGGRFFQRGDGGPPVEALQAMLAFYGYNTPVSGEFCARTEGDVAAFQRHFRRERVDGIADFSTIDTLHRLLKALPQV
ncbi:N-acetylmuramoyl-L-alanine amidase [Rhizobium sp. KVB221]|uniref:N-acetylmuramoyl-L-alanine amidase n=1 Tax=Rhizobium setariae TaxID=2801340 RepID=A0A936YTB3_9HYPH|nr:N-acetylmuramoyl-L-alanine amidase [Rhizobium setariae]MBL0374486.1 N-acetylmuramoyl-L-alanine amidase [Rhizobium setariae]